ncbi:hypothetical protein BH23BAC1_BH23BAC1_05240 [soil metagenome]
MNDLENLILKVNTARHQFISAASGLTPKQAYFKPSQEEWSITDNIEHMVWAEQGGINGIWRAIEGIRENNPVWKGENVNKGLSIEKIIENTWQPKEKVPESAKPRWGRPVDYWIVSLQNCQRLLEAMSKALTGLDIEQIIYPHPISGPLNLPQRMEFLRFHLERHQRQIENVKNHPEFPE